MGLNTISISDALFSKTQQKVFGLLYGRPDKTFYLNEIVRLANIGKGTVKRVLEKMLAARLVTVIRIGNQSHYQANAACPIYNELIAIVRKTSGLVDVLIQALAPLNEKIQQAFVFGSMASGQENSSSDVDLLLVGDVSYSEVVKALYPAQEVVGREINPKVFSEEEWNQMSINKDAFVKELQAKPKLFIVGVSDESG